MTNNNLEEYLDLDELAIWESFLTETNNDCLTILNSFETKALELQSVWSGNAANSFDDNFSTQLKQAKEHHNELTDVNKFLNKVAETLREQ